MEEREEEGSLTMTCFVTEKGSKDSQGGYVEQMKTILAAREEEIREKVLLLPSPLHLSPLSSLLTATCSCRLDRSLSILARASLTARIACSRACWDVRLDS